MVIFLPLDIWSMGRGRYYPLIAFLILVSEIFVFLCLAISKQGVIGFLWCYPAILALYFLLSKRQSWIVNAFLLIIALSKVWNTFARSVVIRAIVTLITVSILSAIFISAIAFSPICSSAPHRFENRDLLM